MIAAAEVDRDPSASVAVDAELCLGSQMCLRTAPDLFRFEGDVSVPVRPLLTAPADMDRAVDAMHGCPFGAIEVADVL